MLKEQTSGSVGFDFGFDLILLLDFWCQSGALLDAGQVELEESGRHERGETALVAEKLQRRPVEEDDDGSADYYGRSEGVDGGS